MSIIRVGLAETKGFSDGYDAIFGGKKKEEQPKKKPLPPKPGPRKSPGKRNKRIV